MTWGIYKDMIEKCNLVYYLENIILIFFSNLSICMSCFLKNSWIKKKKKTKYEILSRIIEYKTEIKIV